MAGGLKAGRGWSRRAWLLLGLLSATASAAEPLWVAKGLQQPESALYVAAEKAIFVSNVNGDPAAHDGNGYIARLKPDGTVDKLQWLTGLDAPKGLAYAQGKLFVTDIDRIHEIDVATASIARTYEAKGAKFLNDIALEPRSHFRNQTARAYISDMMDDAIWYLADNSLSFFQRDAALDAPNGLLVEGEELRVASTGRLADGKPTAAGRIKTLPLDGDTVTDRFGAAPLGALDGIEPDGKNGYWVGDWLAGRVLHVNAEGGVSVWLELGSSVNDIALGPKRTLLVPMMALGEVRAYVLPK
jgi:hypothetical protein